jgi:streptogramin lyase
VSNEITPWHQSDDDLIAPPIRVDHEGRVYLHDEDSGRLARIEVLLKRLLEEQLKNRKK